MSRPLRGYTRFVTKKLLKTDDSNKNSIAAESVGNEASGTNAQSLKQSDENGSGMICLFDSSIGPQIMDMLLWYRMSTEARVSATLLKKAFPNDLQDLRAGLENVDVKTSQRIDKLRDEEVIEDRDDSNKNSIAAESVGNEASGTNAQSLKQSDENGSGMICLSDPSIGPQIMDMLQYRNINADASGVKRIAQRKARCSLHMSSLTPVTVGSWSQEFGQNLEDPCKLSGSEVTVFSNFVGVTKSKKKRFWSLPDLGHWVRNRAAYDCSRVKSACPLPD
ncbi:peroxidase superfamily protein [Actinidia rufa]|uniref:Peroxidase superfamily protein n=1 Tax=Actinidia rufa TaxID=165716 RepID=A0A7J0GE94_9ERIC|nr:peroxidase superfamily protein [Actinidia rufa]